MGVWFFYKNLLSENKTWFKRVSIWAGICLFAGILTYVFHPELLPKFLDFLRQVFQGIFGRKDPVLDFRSAVLVFKNNFLVSLGILFLGIFFGLLPLLSIAVNFFIFGFLLAALLAAKTFSGIGSFLLAVGPHGILEIPAFLLAAAFGLRLGLFWVSPARHLSRLGNLRLALKQNFLIVPLLALLFFAAALLEIFVTGNLVKFLK